MTLNDLSSPMALLLTRRSAKARELAAPGPTADQLRLILTAAARVPDHGKLAPWRFVEIVDRDALRRLILDSYAAAHPDTNTKAMEKLDGFAHQAPCLVAMLSLPQDGKISRWEQQLSAGAAAQNLLLAAHALGFVANWLTGPASELTAVAEALGGRDSRVVGFFFIGTPTRAPEERPRPAAETIVSRWPA